MAVKYARPVKELDLEYIAVNPVILLNEWKRNKQLEN